MWEMAGLPIPKDPGLAFSFATLVSFTDDLGCKVTEFHKEQGLGSIMHLFFFNPVQI